MMMSLPFRGLPREDETAIITNASLAENPDALSPTQPGPSLKAEAPLMLRPDGATKQQDGPFHMDGEPRGGGCGGDSEGDDDGANDANDAQAGWC